VRWPEPASPRSERGGTVGAGDRGAIGDEEEGGDADDDGHSGRQSPPTPAAALAAAAAAATYPPDSNGCSQIAQIAVEDAGGSLSVVSGANHDIARVARAPLHMSSAESTLAVADDRQSLHWTNVLAN